MYLIGTLLLYVHRCVCMYICCIFKIKYVSCSLYSVFWYSGVKRRACSVPVVVSSVFECTQGGDEKYYALTAESTYIPTIFF
jgi:hypothetical protein